MFEATTDARGRSRSCDSFLAYGQRHGSNQISTIQFCEQMQALAGSVPTCEVVASQYQ